MAISGDLTIDRAVQLADPEVRTLLTRLQRGIADVRSEMDLFQFNARRAERLYYAEDITQWGADLWAADPSAKIPGMAHVSVNTPATYVDLPAALQSVEPTENMVPTDTTEGARTAAAGLERLYESWKREEEFELKFAQVCVIKGIYARTAARVYWDEDEKRPCIEIIEKPQQLYLGWKSDTYKRLDWAAFLMRMTPNAVREAYGVEVTQRQVDGLSVPAIAGAGVIDLPLGRPWLQNETGRIDVWDYWYRDWNPDAGKFVTWNAVLVGNAFGRPPTPYAEYDGEIPYEPISNSFVPGMPNGRSALYDVEHLIREKFETITRLSQVITAATAGDYWQLVGPDAPSRAPTDLKPKRNEIIAPGPGNRIETIQPFVAQFQAEQYLARIDREMEVITGLNDLLLGLAPAAVLGSSRAVNALVAQYEMRLRISRAMLYSWRKRLWERVLKVWVAKDPKVKQIVDAGGGVLDIIAPTLSPRDELDTANKAANLMNAKIWSQRRSMDAVGVDDPETEQDMIREERTDATMFPAEVQVMAQLLAALQQLGIQPPQNVQGQAAAQAGTASSDLRNALGAATPANTESQQAPADQGQTPPEALSAGATPPAAPFAQGPAAQSAPVLQSMIQGGKASGRILTQQKLNRR